MTLLAGEEEGTHVVVVGNVALDRAGNGWAPGGPSLYSARAAHCLGAQVTLVTRLPAAYPRDVLRGLDVRALPADDCPRYENAYDDAGRRRQRLLAPGAPLTLDGPLPRGDAVLFAPAYHELDALPLLESRVVAAALQGVLRTADGAGHVRPVDDPAAAAHRLVFPGAFAFFSDEDVPRPHALGESLAAAGVTAIVTRGPAGASLYSPGAPRRDCPGFPATIVDPTGAGDVFAAAFVVRMVETGDVEAACAFANAAGAVSVEASGLAGVPRRARVEERMLQGAA